MATVTPNEVDHETDCLISGFIREMQRALPQNITFYIIPELVNYKCFRFYQILEFFDQFGPDIEIKKNGNYVQKIRCHGYNCAYGNLCITQDSNCIYSWKFKIGEQPFGTYIGITSSKNMETEIRFVTDKENYFYVYSNGGFKYDLPNRDEDGYGSTDGFGYDNDVIMEMNVAEKVLTFCVTGSNDTIIFKNINFDEGTVYRMAVCMFYLNTSVELVEFTTRYRK